jgi:glycosyltransferase involved in cell wall biosynthesis
VPDRKRPELILVVHDLAGGGGMETVLRRQLPDLTEDWQVTVVSCTMDPALLERVTWLRVRVPTFPAWLKTLSFWVAAGSLLRPGSSRRRASAPGGVRPLLWTIGAIVPVRADAISVHFCHAGYVHQVGWAVGVRGLRRVNARWSRLLSLTLEKWSYRKGRVGSLLAVSRGLADEVARYYPGLPVEVTPNGIDVPLLDERQPRTGPLRVLFVGGDWARKGLETVIRAVADLDGVVLTVVGDGPDALGPGLAKTLGIEDRVAFRGWTSDVSPYYRASDVLVLASHYETFGMVVFEAASYGVVPVVTPVHGATDLVEDGVSGFVVSPGVPASVASVLTRLRDDVDLAVRIGREARTRATRFGWDRSVESVSHALALLLSPGPR